MSNEIEKVVEEQDEIVVGDPQLLRPVDLPLVVTLPAGASEAQKQYAKYLNAYAYQNPKKWAEKKDDRDVLDERGNVTGKVKGLITKLKELKNAPDPVLESNLKIGSNRLN